MIPMHPLRNPSPLTRLARLITSAALGLGIAPSLHAISFDPFRLTFRILEPEPGLCRIVIDPQSTAAFQLDFRFDSTRYTYAGLHLMSPFVQTTPPDLSLVNAGMIRDISGTATRSGAGTNLFYVDLRDLGTAPPTVPSFLSVIAGDDDFIEFSESTPPAGLPIAQASLLNSKYGHFTFTYDWSCGVPDSDLGMFPHVVLGGLLVVGALRPTLLERQPSPSQPVQRTPRRAGDTKENQYDAADHR